MCCHATSQLRDERSSRKGDAPADSAADTCVVRRRHMCGPSQRRFLLYTAATVVSYITLDRATGLHTAILVVWGAHQLPAVPYARYHRYTDPVSELCVAMQQTYKLLGRNCDVPLPIAGIVAAHSATHKGCSFTSLA